MEYGQATVEDDLEYVSELMDDFELTPNDKLGDLIEALEEEARAFAVNPGDAS